MNYFFQKLCDINSFIIFILNNLFGEHWSLFLLYFVLNLIDIFMGIIKEKKLNFNIIKKLGNWILIFVSFLMAASLEEIGSLIEINLTFFTFLGWSVLAFLIITECKNILLKIIDIECDVPSFLINGLDRAFKRIEDKGDSKNE